MPWHAIRKDSTERANILFIISLWLVFLSALALYTHEICIRSQKLISDEVISSKNKNKELYSFFETNLLNTAKQYLPLECAEILLSGQKFGLSRQFCFKHLEVMPDFDSLFKSSDNCEIIPQTLSTKTAGGVTLMPGSAVWSKTCINISQITNEKFATKSNLAITAPIQITSLNQNPRLIIAAGYTEFSASLNVAENLIIISGGDIILGEINIQNGKSLYLVSSSGAVTINNSTDSTNIYAYASLGIISKIPVMPIPENVSAGFPFIKRQVLGVIGPRL